MCAARGDDPVQRARPRTDVGIGVDHRIARLLDQITAEDDGLRACDNHDQVMVGVPRSGMDNRDVPLIQLELGVVNEMVGPPPCRDRAVDGPRIGTMVKRVGAQPVCAGGHGGGDLGGTVEPGVAEPRAAQHMVEVVVRQHDLFDTLPCEQPDILLDRPGLGFGRTGIDEQRSVAAAHHTDRHVEKRQPGSPDPVGQSLPAIIH